MSTHDYKQSKPQQAVHPKTKQRKRAQVRLACTNCRKAHACCDEVRPCKRCVKNNLGASCQDLPRRRRTASTRKSDEHDEVSTSSSSKRKSRGHSEEADADFCWHDEDHGFIQPQASAQAMYPTMIASDSQPIMMDTILSPTNNIPSVMSPIDNNSRYSPNAYSSDYQPSAVEYTNGTYIQPATSVKLESQTTSPNNQLYYPVVSSPPWRSENTQIKAEQDTQLSRTTSPTPVPNGAVFNPSPRSNIFPHRIPVFESYKNTGYPTAIWTFNTRLLVDCNRSFEDLILDNVKMDNNSIVKFRNFLHSGRFSCFDLFPTYFLPYANECYTSLISEMTAADTLSLPAENAHEMIFKRPDGGEVSVLVTCTPIFGGNRSAPECPQVTHYVMQIIRLQSMPARAKAASVRIEPYSPPNDQSVQQQEAPLDQFSNMALNDNSMQYQDTQNQYYADNQLQSPSGYVLQQQLGSPNNGQYSYRVNEMEDLSYLGLDPQTPNPQQFYGMDQQYGQNMTSLS